MRLRRYRRVNFSWSPLKIIILILSILIMTIFIVEITLRPIFTDLAEVQAQKITSKLVNDALKKHSSSLSHEQLVTYDKDVDGRIVMMRANTALINSFASCVLQELSDSLEKLSEEVVQIPLAHLFGMRVLAGLGPRIKLKIIPFGFLEPPIVCDGFESVGINQTRHRIYIKFTAGVKVLTPFISKLVKAEYQAPISEVTIMGEVPKVYVNLKEGLLAN